MSDKTYQRWEGESWQKGDLIKPSLQKGCQEIFIKKKIRAKYDFQQKMWQGDKTQKNEREKLN